jgi:hypothetical protein
MAMINMSRIDLNMVQGLLGSTLQLEFHHVLAHLLPHCVNVMNVEGTKVKGSELESLTAFLIVLIGLYVFDNCKNQESLLWGKRPTPLQVCISLHFLCSIAYIC